MVTKSLRWGLFFLFIFLVFSIFVSLGMFKNFDQYLTITLQSVLTKTLDTPLSLLSLLGSFEITTILLLAILFKLRLKKSLAIIFIFGLGMGIELIGKTFLNHPGPPNIYFRYDLDLFFPSAYVQTGHSYPSGHSYRTAFIIFILIHLIMDSKNMNIVSKKYLNLLLVFILFLMIISRISLGEHWSTDVIGGLLLGISLALFSIHLTNTGFKAPNRVK